MAVALGWCVEKGEISARYGNGQNKLLSALGSVCPLHQHLAPTLAQGVFLLPVFSRSNLFYNGRNAVAIPGLVLSTAWHGVAGRKEGRHQNPGLCCGRASLRLPPPCHLLPFHLLT